MALVSRASGDKLKYVRIKVVLLDETIRDQRSNYNSS